MHADSSDALVYAFRVRGLPGTSASTQGQARRYTATSARSSAARCSSCGVHDVRSAQTCTEQRTDDRWAAERRDVTSLAYL